MVKRMCLLVAALLALAACCRWARGTKHVKLDRRRPPTVLAATTQMVTENAGEFIEQVKWPTSFFNRNDCCTAAAPRTRPATCRGDHVCAIRLHVRQFRNPASGSRSRARSARRKNPWPTLTARRAAGWARLVITVSSRTEPIRAC